MGCNLSLPCSMPQSQSQTSLESRHSPYKTQIPPYETRITQRVQVKLPSEKDLRQPKQGKGQYLVTSKHWAE